MRRLAIYLSLLVTACGGVVIRQDGTGGTTSTASRDGGVKTAGPSTGGAIGNGAGGFGVVTVTTSSGGTTSGGAPYTGGRVGAAGFIGIGGDPVDAGIGGSGITGGFGGESGVGGVAGFGGLSGVSGYGGLPVGGDYVCIDRFVKDLVCVPSPLPSAPIPCTTTAVTSDPAGLEGRCIRSCSTNAFRLHRFFDAGQPECPSGSVCAPCYDPIDATPTGACAQSLTNNGGSDKPKRPAPVPYATCPDGDAGVAPFAGGGICIPEAMANRLAEPATPLYNPLITDLKQDNCAMGEKCMPSAKAADPMHCATPCTTAMALVGIGYARGACVPKYVVYDTAGQAGVTIYSGTQGEPNGCEPGELCYSCNDPLRAGQPTGACY